MNKPLLLTCLGLNASLAIWIGLRQPAPAKRSAEPVSVQAEPIANSARPKTDFNWARLESPDFKSYISNLRRLGCPNETITDLIIADVRKTLFRRAQRLGGEAAANLENDIKWTLDNLLGEGWEVSWTETLGDSEELGRLTFLPGELAALVRQIEENADAQMQDLDGGTPQWQTERMIFIEQEKLQQLQVTLEPMHLAAYLRTNHPVGKEVVELGFACADDQEFLNLFNSWFDFDLAARVAEYTPSTSSVNLRLAEQAREERIRSGLGEERYQEYEKASNPDYQNLKKIAQSYNLPKEVSDQVFQLNARLDNELVQLDACELPAEALAEAREAHIRLARAETRELLGEEAYLRYRGQE